MLIMWKLIDELYFCSDSDLIRGLSGTTSLTPNVHGKGQRSGEQFH